jgi:hypothetical protein
MPALIRTRAHGRARTVGTLIAAAFTAAALVLLFVLPAAAGGKDDEEDLRAVVVATTAGPLPACAQDQSDCTPANAVVHFVHVENELKPTRGGASRVVVPNAFVVNGIDEHVFVDGVDTFDFVEIPPPNTNNPPFAGHWPSTVVCPTTGPPCNVVVGTAVLPDEDVAVFYSGWVHGNAEPNGTYVFKFTIHGTLNGAPVDLTATSKPILMTP